MKILKHFTLMILLCVVSIGLCACGSSSISMPNTDDTITGNGGVSVVKGDYLYTTNGYLSRDTITMDNRADDDYVNSGLYVIELDNGQFTYDDDGEIENITKLSGYIVGYEYTDIYIYGDYIYYNTPSRGKTASGYENAESTTTNTLSEFRRMKLNGDDDTLLYTTTTDMAEISYDLISVEGTVHLIILDDGELKDISVSGKVSTYSVDENVTSYTTLSAEEDIVNNTYNHNGMVYYTTTIDDDDYPAITAGNILLSYDMDTNDTTRLVADSTTTYALLEVSTTTLYYQAYTTNSYGYSSDVRVYSAPLDNISNNTKITSMDYDSVYIMISEELDSMDYTVAISSTTTLLIDNETQTSTVLSDTAISMLDVRNSYIYYSDGTNLLRINVLAKNQVYTPETIYSGSETLSYSAGCIDADGTYVYAYFTADNDYGTLYTYRINVNNGTYIMAGVYEYGEDPDFEDE